MNENGEKMIISKEELNELKKELEESEAYFEAERGSNHFDQKNIVREIKLRFNENKEEISNYTKKLAEEGYVEVPNLFTDEEISQIKSSFEPQWDSIKNGKTNFHGYQTKRVHGIPLRIHADIATKILANPKILSIVDQFLPENYLVGDWQGIKTAPGETKQPLHYDNSVYKVIHRRGGDLPEFAMTTLLALEDFTIENGATRIIPKSHLWGQEIPKEFELKHLTLKKGSVGIWSGNLYHSAGENKSNNFRYAILTVYSNPYLRTLENFTLVDKKILKNYSPIVQSLFGFSLVPPYVGSLDGLSPVVYLRSNL